MIYLSFTWDVTNTIAKITKDSLNTKYYHIPIQLYGCMWACVCAYMHVHMWVDICVHVCACEFSLQMNVLT